MATFQVAVSDRRIHARGTVVSDRFTRSVLAERALLIAPIVHAVTENSIGALRISIRTAGRWGVGRVSV